MVSTKRQEGHFRETQLLGNIPEIFSNVVQILLTVFPATYEKQN